MPAPPYFSWIEKPILAAMGYPYGVDELRWVRAQGIELLISLTEDPPYTRDVSDAGLLLYHVPIIDMTAPTQDELDRCISAIMAAKERGMGVGVHCRAGQGRTGTVIACYLVAQNRSADEAIAETRRMRPASIETNEQEECVREFARRKTG